MPGHNLQFEGGFVDSRRFSVAATLFAIALEGNILPRNSAALADAPMFCYSPTAAGNKYIGGRGVSSGKTILFIVIYCDLFFEHIRHISQSVLLIK